VGDRAGLEIGCGQDDMTAVLADMVGSDACWASRSPVTFGQSVDHLLAGPPGARIEIRLDADVLAATFPEVAVRLRSTRFD
jgi:hypothetical protein